MAGRLRVVDEADSGVGLASHAHDPLGRYRFVRQSEGLQSLSGVAVSELEMDSCFERFAAEATGQRAANFAHGNGGESVTQRLAANVLEFGRSPQSCWQAKRGGGNVPNEPGRLWGILTSEPVLRLRSGKRGFE